MSMRVYVDLDENPYECVCQSSDFTTVDSETVTQNLLRHNPLLGRFLNRKEQPTKTSTAVNTLIEGRSPTAKSQRSEKSISPKNGHDSQHLTSKDVLDEKGAQKDGKKGSQKERVLGKHFKDVSDSSRYLSNTGFRKYFDRQCFQNYGHANRNRVEDGIIYGNYMKTYNINPHSGSNIRIDEETFTHSLISASPDKLVNYTQIQQAQELLKENSHYHQMQKKYQEGRVKTQGEARSQGKVRGKQEREEPKRQQQIEQQKKEQQKRVTIRIDSPKSDKAEKDLEQRTEVQSILKSGGAPKLPLKQTQTPKQQVPQVSSPKNRRFEIEENSPEQQPTYSQRKVNPVPRNQEIKSSAVTPRRIQPVKHTSPRGPLACRCKGTGSNHQCKCCLDRIKKEILQEAERDPNLASRLLTSARKTTMYKNYSLNNVENAGKNPHNYRQCCGQLQVMQ